MMRSSWINGEGELSRQPANPGSRGKMAVKMKYVWVCLDALPVTQPTVLKHWTIYWLYIYVLHLFFHFITFYGMMRYTTNIRLICWGCTTWHCYMPCNDICTGVSKCTFWIHGQGWPPKAGTRNCGKLNLVGIKCADFIPAEFSFPRRRFNMWIMVNGSPYGMMRAPFTRQRWDLPSRAGPLHIPRVGPVSVALLCAPLIREYLRRILLLKLNLLSWNEWHGSLREYGGWQWSPLRGVCDFHFIPECSMLLFNANSCIPPSTCLRMSRKDQNVKLLAGHTRWRVCVSYLAPGTVYPLKWVFHLPRVFNECRSPPLTDRLSWLTCNFCICNIFSCLDYLQLRYFVKRRPSSMRCPVRILTGWFSGAA